MKALKNFKNCQTGMFELFLHSCRSDLMYHWEGKEVGRYERVYNRKFVAVGKGEKINLLLVISSQELNWQLKLELALQAIALC